MSTKGNRYARKGPATGLAKQITSQSRAIWQCTSGSLLLYVKQSHKHVDQLFP